MNSISNYRNYDRNKRKDLDDVHIFDIQMSLSVFIFIQTYITICSYSYKLWKIKV